MTRAIATGCLLFFASEGGALAQGECQASISTPATLSAEQHAFAASVDTSRDCSWVAHAPPGLMVVPSTGTGPQSVRIHVSANPLFTARSMELRLNDTPMVLIQAASEDSDHDELPDGWERQFGLTVTARPDFFDEFGDPDFDDVPNRDELRNGTHPRGRDQERRVLAEGANGHFTTTLALVATEDESTSVLLTFLGAEGPTLSWPVMLRRRVPVYIDTTGFAGVSNGAFGVLADSTGPIVLERLMQLRDGGGHVERAFGHNEARGGSEWLFAEGLTALGAQVFYLVANPTDTTASVTWRVLGAAGPERVLEVPPLSRRTLWVNVEAPEAAAAEFGARFRSTQEVRVERAMYLPDPLSGRLMASTVAQGAVAKTVAAQSFAEGVANDVVNTFFSVVNPLPFAIPFTLKYYLPDGRTATDSGQVEPESRATVWPNLHPELRNTAFATVLAAGAGVIVERTMWWPGDASSWYEGHTSGPVPTITAGASAYGYVDESADTYYLLANFTEVPAYLVVTLTFEDGSFTSRTLAVAAGRRVDIDVKSTFPEARGRRFSGWFQSLNDVPLAIECATYRSEGGRWWAVGTATGVFPLPSR